MNEQHTSTEKNTQADAYTGTSGVQHIKPDAALLRNGHNVASSEPSVIAGIGGTPSSTFWGMQTLRTHGTNTWNFGFPGVLVNAGSQVSVSMMEIKEGWPPVGDATMQVYNVVPTDDGTVWVRYNVNWGSDLIIRFNFIVVN
jgi:hypothetical protein